MPNSDKTLKPAEYNRQLFRRFRDARVGEWDSDARDAQDFYLGNHYTQSESDNLRAVGQGDFVLDRVYPAIDRLESELTAKSPKFSAVSREDSDAKLSKVWRVILEYVWDISDGDIKFKQAIHDYSIAGLGYLYAYTDYNADYGRGEVKFTHINPYRVYVDPNARDRYFQDASSIILSTIMTQEQLLAAYPEVSNHIDKIDTMEGEDDYPSPAQKNSVNAVTPEEAKNLDTGEAEHYRIIERFHKIPVKYHRIKQLSSGKEIVLDEDEYGRFVEEQGEGLGEGLYRITEVEQMRVKVTASVGQYLLYEDILNTENYPVVPLINIWTGTPYPKSDVNKVKDAQRLLDKLFSLMLSHAQSSAGLKLLIPEGSVEDLAQIERDWANPNAVIPYNADFGEPHFATPAALSSEFYNLVGRVEHYLDLTFGVPEMMQGFKEAAPQTVRGTAMLSEMGESRSKSKLRDIENALTILGRVIYGLAKQHYSYLKTFRLVQPNNDLTEVTVNQLYDDHTQTVGEMYSDLYTGEYDIRVVGGSTLPSNKMAEYQMYLEAFKLGIIDDVEVLKKSEIFDKEGVLKRKSVISQMSQVVGQLQENVKKLSGDLQTAERKALTSEMKVITEKFKAKLDRILNRSDRDQKESVDEIKDIARELEFEKQKQKQKTSDEGKGSLKE